VASPTLTEGTAVSRHPQAVVGALPGETVLLRVDTGTTLRLNASAAWLWEQLDGPLGLGELAGRLAGRHSLSADAAAADVRRFVTELAERKFVVLS
jgi:hypothetical protein